MSLSFDDPDEGFSHICSKVKNNYNMPKNMSGICFDVGCNVGAFSVVHHKRFSKIYAFEASEETSSRSLKNFDKFGVENVTLYRRAVSSKDGEVLKLRPYDNHTGKQRSGDASVLEFLDEKTGHGYMPDSEFEEVESISLEGMLELTGVEQIDYLKCDIEGSEYDFLYGKDLSMIGFLALEIHVQLGEKRKELVEWIEKWFTQVAGNKTGAGHWELSYRKK